jgi:adenylate cyclase
VLSDSDLWNRERREAGAEPVEISIELHYGMVVLGEVGSTRRLGYAVLGDTVDVARRLEELTRTLGVQLAMSDDLVSVVRDDTGMDVATLLSGLGDGGPQSLLGRDEPIAVWT